MKSSRQFLGQFLGQFSERSQQIILLGLTFLTVGTIAKPAQAFDTGHHFDLTRDAMQDQGFGNTAIEVTQLENWLTDYYSSSPTSTIEAEVGKLHFDNLFNTQQVRNQWGHFTVNTRNAVQQATRSKDPVKLLAVMGISLHAVQDFYTHSNWVETHPATSSSYRTDTWFSSPITATSNIYTGLATSYKGTPPVGHPQHGGYDSGLNKDEYGRPGWDNAYVFAYAGSREWINAMRTWVNEIDPTFWATTQAFNVSGGDRAKLTGDLEAVYRISEWVKSGSENGHWKGRGSGNRADFLTFSAGWIAKPDGRFVSEFKDKKTYLLLSKGLTGNTPPTTAVPTVPRLPLTHRAILLKTLSVAEKNDVGFFETKIDPLGKADFYAQITVAGQTFTEAMQLDKASISPAWQTVKFVRNTATQIPIRYQLWDEDGVLRGGDDHIDINSRSKVRDLNFSFAVGSHNLSGDVSGVHDRSTNPVKTNGAKPDNNRAVLQFYVTDRPLNP